MVELEQNDYVLTLSRSEFLLLTDALSEHLLLRRDRFDVMGYDHERATAFANELAALTRRARAGLDPGADEGS